MQYIIYTDESEKYGKYYGNFYGGALIRSADFDAINSALNTKREALNIHGEIKWQKVGEAYLDKYTQMMELFFNYIAQDKIKIRIMFTQNILQPTGLSKEQKENQYFLLYYQFFKHVFGFQYSNPSSFRPISLYIMMDQLPDKKEKNERFKKFIYNLQDTDVFRKARLHFNSMSDIGEATSHDHIILQCLDVVLGSIEFKLNGKNEEKPEGKRVRGKRTRAKEKLYKYINKRIREIYPGFNVGDSTGISTHADRWNHPYRHWKFIPSNNQINKNYVPKRK
ncbi:DUF3800 domain-containing protein [Paenibacillus sp. USDA918EY]|uniref:DUF3800 domain-containing protein n=1 Tax=Paenibacillus sp. USDA918EY TaxID=2689575 RepID=UPI00135CF607|nr:DUF3800 domain-containing protein [Paenibacillus sp. USDA918EY]